jgi:hypothetical protein
MSGLTAGNLLVVCGAGAVTCTKSVPRKETPLQLQLAVTASWQRGRKLTLPIIGAADTPRRSFRKGRLRGHLNDNRKGVLLESLHPRCVLRCGSPRQ